MATPVRPHVRPPPGRYGFMRVVRRAGCTVPGSSLAPNFLVLVPYLAFVQVPFARMPPRLSFV